MLWLAPLSILKTFLEKEYYMTTFFPSKSHLTHELNVLSLFWRHTTFYIIAVFHIQKVSRVNFFIFLEVMKPTKPIWFRDMLSIIRENSLHSFTFNFQMQPRLLIFASFEFFREVLRKALWVKFLSELVKEPAGLGCSSVACAVLWRSWTN